MRLPYVEYRRLCLCSQIKLAKIMALIPTDQVPHVASPRQRARSPSGNESNNATRDRAAATLNRSLTRQRFVALPTMQVSAKFLSGGVDSSDASASGVAEL